MKRFARRHPLLLYIGIAFAVMWTFVIFEPFDPFFAPVLGAFAPGIAAIVVTGLSEGESGVKSLWRRFGTWRLRPVWYLVAFGLPLAEGVLAIGIATALGSSTAGDFAAIGQRLGPILPAIWVVFLLAAGEELGWRGFALLHLLRERTGLEASLILGTVHSTWHLPLLLLPHRFLSDVPILPYTAAVVAEAVVFTWIFQHTRGSVLLASLFHGMSNIAMVLYSGIDPAWMPWLKSSISVLVALALLLSTGSSLMRKSEIPK